MTVDISKEDDVTLTCNITPEGKVSLSVRHSKSNCPIVESYTVFFSFLIEILRRKDDNEGQKIIHDILYWANKNGLR